MDNLTGADNIRKEMEENMASTTISWRSIIRIF